MHVEVCPPDFIIVAAGIARDTHTLKLRLRNVGRTEVHSLVRPPIIACLDGVITNCFARAYQLIVTAIISRSAVVPMTPYWQN